MIASEPVVEESAAVVVEPALILINDRRSFRLGDGPEVCLKDHRLLWRVLTVLADAKRGNDGPASPDMIADVAWPGELMSSRSRKNRLHVALHRLRVCGLAGVIRNVRIGRNRSGWLLTCAVVLDDAGLN